MNSAITNRGRVLLVDDDVALRENLAATLADQGFDAAPVSDGQEALDKLDTWPADVIVTDLIMPRMDGFELLRALRTRGQVTPAIVLTGFGNLEKALAIIRDLNAFWFLEKPVRLNALQSLLERAIEHNRLFQEKELLKRDLMLRGALGSLVGRSRAMQGIFSLIRQAAPSSVTVLLAGESGTGKELAAREIHNLSLRAAQPFVALNCAALPESLMESELFGHERGSFTGAFERHVGCFEQAHRGTLFLDEITEMPMATQSKLLRALEERSIRSLGGKGERSVDVRLIASTNRPLAELHPDILRSDLYYRLNVFPIELPALRERIDDIRLLAESMVSMLNERHGTKITSIAPDVLDRFVQYSWPGNVRELRNVMERATILAGTGRIEVDHILLDPAQSPAALLLESAREDGADSITLRPGLTLSAVESAFIELTLRHTKLSRKRAAGMLGISVRTLQSRINDRRKSLRAEDRPKAEEEEVIDRNTAGGELNQLCSHEIS